MANPFAALFHTEEDASQREEIALRQNKELSFLLVRIFLFTGSDCIGTESKNLPRYVVRLPQLVANEKHDQDLTLRNYLLGLAERLILSSSSSEYLLEVKSNPDSHNLVLAEKENAIESSPIKYLAECYARAENESSRKRNVEESGYLSQVKAKIVKDCEEMIVERACTIICTDHAKAMLQSTSHDSLFLQLFKKAIVAGSLIPLKFFEDIAKFKSSDVEALKSIFGVILEDLYSSHRVLTLSSTGLDYDYRVLEFFASHADLSKVLIHCKHWLPHVKNNGKAFESQTLLGRYLSPSCIAQSLQSPSSDFPVALRYFQSEVQETTSSVRHHLEYITTSMYKVFDGLLRACPESKRALISWLVLCFDSNKDRGKMASRLHQTMGVHANLASDGFFVNLCWVMLHLSSPFMTYEDVSPRKHKMGAIDVKYCALTSTNIVDGDEICRVDFSGEARLIPGAEAMSGDPQQPKSTFNFITHCFFLTHKCLMLGMTQVINKYQDISRNLSRLHSVVESMGNMEPTPGTPLWYFGMFSSQLLAIKAHALHPILIELCLSFYSRTALWLVQLVSNEFDLSDAIPDKPPTTVQMVPECIVDNMSNIVMALRQMESQLILPRQQIHQYISFCTLYMRSSTFIINPHIRAKLARLIHFIIYQGQTGASAESMDFQGDLFSSHHLASKHLVSALLSIFVDIEHTGESMEFEDKFMYRLPMYEVLEFLWRLPAYKASINNLTEEVVAHSGMTHHVPVFLRFINMIINDAILQLDEGLQSLVTIKELEALQDSSEWESLSNDRKKEHEEKLKEAKMYAINRNKLSSKTVNVLEVITKDTAKAFVIPSIVDRMAAMLNYVLNLLVGKRSRELKVRDTEKYHFNPRTLVMNIVAIYINLGQEKCFCEALPRDGRSFSLDLFPQAERVIRIVSGCSESVITEWRRLGESVKECYDQLLLQDTVFENPPEEFLDPLTQELMVDPVILPTSGNTIDRSSIMRHLLSDQQDPFNRATLTADMLQSNNELQARITEWKQKQIARMHNK